MRHLFFITAIFFALSLLVSAPPSYAQSPSERGSPYKGGMHHKIIGQKESGTAPRHLQVKTINTSPAPSPEEAPQEEETTQRRIWNKYKALASGQPNEDENQTDADTNESPMNETESKGTKTLIASPPPARAPYNPDKPNRPHKLRTFNMTQDSAPLAQGKPSGKPSGFSSLINRYNQNKSQRGKMRVLTTKSLTPPIAPSSISKSDTKTLPLARPQEPLKTRPQTTQKKYPTYVKNSAY